MKNRRYLNHESAMLPRLLAGRSYPKPMATPKEQPEQNWIQSAIERTKRIMKKVQQK